MRLLCINSTPMSDEAISRRLTKAFVQDWRCKNRDGIVIARDLASIDIPAINAEWICANYTPEGSRTKQQDELLRLSKELIAELHDADEYVIGMPMHNWGPPSKFKLWVDQIVVPGCRGVLSQKSCTFVIATGWHHRPNSARASENYLVPWLRTLFRYLGVEDVRFIMADGSMEIAKGGIDREAFLAPHIEAIHGLFMEGRDDYLAARYMEGV